MKAKTKERPYSESRGFSSSFYVYSENVKKLEFIVKNSGLSKTQLLNLLIQKEHDKINKGRKKQKAL